MSRVRGLATLLLGVLAVVAVVLQSSAFSAVAVRGVVPDLALLVVVAAGLARGSGYATVFGLVTGLLVDLAPPADHLVGRWALALALVGFVAGRVREQSPAPSGWTAFGPTLGTVAVASLVGTSVFAFTGLLLDDAGLGVLPMLGTILVAVVWDVLVGALVVAPVVALAGRVEPARVAY